jgi:putative transposase
MPKKPRMYLPSIPSQVVQRGNDRSPCFFEEDNYWFLLEWLGDACGRYDVAIHACVLMTNHSHLLINDALYKIRYISSDAMVGKPIG